MLIHQRIISDGRYSGPRRPLGPPGPWTEYRGHGNNHGTPPKQLLRSFLGFSVSPLLYSFQMSKTFL